MFTGLVLDRTDLGSIVHHLLNKSMLSGAEEAMQKDPSGESVKDPTDQSPQLFF